MVTSKLTSNGLLRIPPAVLAKLNASPGDEIGFRIEAGNIVLEGPDTEADIAAWGGLLDEWLGPENDIYGKLLGRSDSSGSSN